MCAFFTNEDITEEERDRIIARLAEKINEYKMQTIAILTLETIKPLVYVGGEISRVFLAPFLPLLGKEFSVMGEKYITIFENYDNIEKLIQLLETKPKKKDSEKHNE
jgi:hypothetical protein